MKFLITIITSIVLIQCSSPEKVDRQNHINYTTSDLEGDWTLIKVETIEEKQSIARFKEDGGDPEILSEWAPPVFLNQEGILTPHSDDFYSISNRDLHINGDSIFWLNYPLKLEQKSAYMIEADLLKIENNPDHRQIVLSTDRDTLNISFLGAYGLYIKETYQKVTFNDSLLNILKLYKTNLPLLAGTWKIVRESYANDDGSVYKLNFPYEIPDSVQITKEELTNILYQGETYKMMTDGKKRTYSLKYYEGDFILSPTNWLPDDFEGDSEIYLRRLSKGFYEMN